MVKNTVISPNILVELLWKSTISAWFQAICSKLCGNCAFPQNFRTTKISEITVLFVVKLQVSRLVQVILCLGIIWLRYAVLILVVFEPSVRTVCDEFGYGFTFTDFILRKLTKNVFSSQGLKCNIQQQTSQIPYWKTWDFWYIHQGSRNLLTII